MIGQAPASLDEALARIPAGFDPDALGDQDVVYQFLLTGSGARNFYLEVVDRELSIGEGLHSDPDLTVRVSAEDYLQVVANPACDPSEPQRLFISGRIRVHPMDRELVMKLPEAFRAI